MRQKIFDSLKLFLLLNLFNVSVCNANQKSWYYINDDCSIFNRSGNLIKSFYGDLCLFYDDGSYLYKSTDQNINFYDQNAKKIWTIDGFFHHQSTKTINKNKILLIGSENVNGARYDTFNLVNKQDGKIKTIGLAKSANDLHLRKEIINWEKEYFKNVKYEYSHVNSIYEIPRNKSSLSALKEGNFIVTEKISNQVFIIDNKFENIIYSYPLSVFTQSAHDVQVLENGNLLLFANKITGADHSAIYEIDPSKNKIIWKYTSKPKEEFFSEVCGSVQKLANNNILTTAILGKKGAFALEINRAKKIVWKIKLHYPVLCQRVRHDELGSFLLNNNSI